MGRCSTIDFPVALNVDRLTAPNTVLRANRVGGARPRITWHPPIITKIESVPPGGFARGGSGSGLPFPLLLVMRLSRARRGSPGMHAGRRGRASLSHFQVKGINIETHHPVRTSLRVVFLFWPLPCPTCRVWGYTLVAKFIGS